MTGIATCCPSTARGARTRLTATTTASPISRMLPGSLAEGHDAHQRPGLDCTGARDTSASDVAEERHVQGSRASTRYSMI